LDFLRRRFNRFFSVDDKDEGDVFLVQRSELKFFKNSGERETSKSEKKEMADIVIENRI
jgi:hypothetical protein